MVYKSGPSFCQGLHTKNGLDLLLAHGHGAVGLARPYLISYPLHISTLILLKKCCTIHIKPINSYFNNIYLNKMIFVVFNMRYYLRTISIYLSMI